MIPQAAKRKLARFVDVFCDSGAFSEEDSLKIFQAAQNHGLSVRAHVSQLTRTPLEKLLRFTPASLDHVDHVNDADIALLAKSDTLSTLVPGANFFLGTEDYPPARSLMDAGVAGPLAPASTPGSPPPPTIPFSTSLPSS